MPSGPAQARHRFASLIPHFGQGAKEKRDKVKKSFLLAAAAVTVISLAGCNETRRGSGLYDAPPEPGHTTFEGPSSDGPPEPGHTTFEGPSDDGPPEPGQTTFEGPSDDGPPEPGQTSFDDSFSDDPPEPGQSSFEETSSDDPPEPGQDFD